MLYTLLLKAMNSSIIDVCSVLPRNLRQYYADQLLLMTVELQYGR